MKALFGRKFYNIEELREATAAAKKKGVVGLDYTVIREVVLTDEQFKNSPVTFWQISHGLKKAMAVTTKRAKFGTTESSILKREKRY